MQVFGPEAPRSSVAASSAAEGGDGSATAGCPTKKCYAKDGWSTRFHAEEDAAGSNRRSRARSVETRDFRQRESLIAHREEPLPVFFTKNTPGAGPLGQAPQGKNRHKMGWLTGSEDMHPAAQKKCLNQDLPPSEELKAANAVKAHDVAVPSSSRRKACKADLEPSEELKHFNARKAHVVDAKPTRQHGSKAEFDVSDESRRRNDRALLMGPDRVRPARAFKLECYQSEGLRDCMATANYPRRPMSEYGGGRHEEASEAASFVNDRDDAMSVCTSSWSSQAGVSEVPSTYSGRSRRDSQSGAQSDAGRSGYSGSQVSGAGSSQCSGSRDRKSVV